MAPYLDVFHIVLGLIFTLSTVAVWYGVYLEKDSFSEEIKARGWRIVVAALAIEAGSGFLLFAVDTGSTVVQEAKIFHLEKKIYDRLIDARDSTEISEALNRYVGQRFEMVAYPDDDESADLADQIGRTLSKASWADQINSGPPVVLVSIVAGVVIYVRGDASPSTRDAAFALRDQLKAKDIRAEVKPSRTLLPTVVDVTVGLRVRLENHGWEFRRSRFPPSATKIMASETSILVS